MRAILALLGLFVLASPLAAAQDAEEKPQSGPERPGDAAWSDCPPDMMCAYGGEGAADGDNATYGDCGAEVCAYDGGEPQPYGNESCIECSTPPPSTCMDSQQEGDVCGDVQYLDGRGPADCENCRGDAGAVSAESAGKNAVPFAQFALVVAALAGAVLLVRRA